MISLIRGNHAVKCRTVFRTEEPDLRFAVQFFEMIEEIFEMRYHCERRTVFLTSAEAMQYIGEQQIQLFFLEELANGEIL